MKCLSAEETVNTSSHSRNSNYNINSFFNRSHPRRCRSDCLRSLLSFPPNTESNISFISKPSTLKNEYLSFAVNLHRQCHFPWNPPQILARCHNPAEALRWWRGHNPNPPTPLCTAACHHQLCGQTDRNEFKENLLRRKSLDHVSSE